MMFSQLLVRRFAVFSPTSFSKRSFCCISKFCLVSKSETWKASQSSTQIRKFWESFPYTKPLLHAKDNLNKEENKLVYRSTMFNYIFYGQLISCSVLYMQMIAGSIYAYKYFAAGEVLKLSTIGSFSASNDYTTILVLFFFTMQNYLVYLAAQKMLLRVYFNEKKNVFTFVSLGTNPFKSRLKICKPGELKRLDDNMLSFIFGNHKLKGRKYFIRMENFKSNQYYNEALGYK